MTARPLFSWKIDDRRLVNTATGDSLPAPDQDDQKFEYWKLLGEGCLPTDAMPSRPRGDITEKTFNLLVRDGIDPRGGVLESGVIGNAAADPERTLDSVDWIDDENKKLFGRIMDDNFVLEVAQPTASTAGQRFLYPFQSLVPGEFKTNTQYKMFNGKILAFMCQPSTDGTPEFNMGLIQRFYDVFNSSDSLTLLDNTMLDVLSDSCDQTSGHAKAEILITSKRSYDPAEPPGALIEDAHEQFQTDLESVLSIGTANRNDTLTATMRIFYLHLALYFERLSYLLEEEFDLAVKATREPTRLLDPLNACFSTSRAESPFVGRLRFRVQRTRPQASHRADAYVTSWKDQDRRQLLLPANLTVLEVARQVLVFIGEPAERWTFATVVKRCRDDAATSTAFTEAMNLLALEVVSGCPQEDRDDIKKQVDAHAPPLAVFREALQKTNRSAQRRHGKDVVNALAKRGGHSYISQRGPNVFYELHQDLLLLLAKVIVRNGKMPFNTFVQRLREYGFDPYSASEQDALADALKALDLLEKHSDAGEAMYVKIF